MNFSEDLVIAFEDYYGMKDCGYFQYPLLNSDYVKEISNIGKQQYELIENLKNKISKEDTVDLAETSTIREFLLLPEEIKHYDKFCEQVLATSGKLFKIAPNKLFLGDMYKVAGCNIVPIRCEIFNSTQHMISIYIKSSHILSDPRAIGIELYSLIGSMKDSYNYPDCYLMARH